MRHDYEVYVFDWDGTCTDTFLGGVRVVLSVALKLGFRIDEHTVEKLRQNFGLQTSQTIGSVWPNATVQDIQKFREALNEYDGNNDLPTFPGVKRVLTELGRRRKKSGIFTSRWADSVGRVLAVHGILQHFAFLHTHSDVRAPKPDPDGLNTICERLAAEGITKKQVLYIGDSVKADWPCAQAAGVDFVATIEGSHARRAEFVAAGVPDDMIISNINELLRFVA